MKKINLIIVFFSLLFLTSCEEVVQIDLNNAAPRIVVEAAIRWQKGTSGSLQKIKLTTTAGYYDTAIPIVSGAVVTVKNSANLIFTFNEINGTGEYVCSNFIPVINDEYTLTVTSKGQKYTATETLKSVAPIVEIIQNDKGGFTGNNIEIKTYFNDPANESNYYLYNYSYSSQVLQNYYVDEDTSYQGNKFFSISQSNKIKKNDKIMVTHFGISKSYYNYLRILLSIASNGGGSPFQSPPATVRGNLINITNADNYPLGYFSLSESDKREFIIQ
ncbi:MAG: hypothetical protein ACI87N_001452 [Flavobacteriales bacterium]|jgi:hypothetical protein